MQSARIGPPLPGVTTVDLDGRVVAYSPHQQKAIFLNETASEIWRLSDGSRALDDLIEQLATAYATDPAAIADDVRLAVASFVDAGLIAEPA